jgi:hypothetical protein
MENAFYITALIGCGVIGFQEHRKIVAMEQKYKDLSIKTDAYIAKLEKEREERMKSIQTLYNYQKFKERS